MTEDQQKQIGVEWRAFRQTSAWRALEDYLRTQEEAQIKVFRSLAGEPDMTKDKLLAASTWLDALERIRSHIARMTERR